MKAHNPKLYRACGQHINASDDNCSDLKRHNFTEYELDNCEHGVIRVTCTQCRKGE